MKITLGECSEGPFPLQESKLIKEFFIYAIVIDGIKGWMCLNATGDEKLSCTSGWRCLKPFLFALRLFVNPVRHAFFNCCSLHHHVQQGNG